MKSNKFTIWMIVVVGFLIFGQPRAAYGDTVSIDENVSIDTSSLQGLGTFTLAFALTDGSGTGDGNTTVTLQNFSFGTGGSSTDFTGTPVALTDNSFFVTQTGNFIAGDLLSFELLINSTSIDSPTPDFFEAVILDSTFTPLPTTDPSGLNNLLSVTLDSSNAAVNTYSIVTPEPSSLLLFLSGLGLTILALRK